ncbi:osmotically inducible protein OsmC [Gordonia iterans]|uniref:Osmotically inducible protein OsmC n=1 Tax=Gordonia iterans TaxID=1004901 RepID=A0A2S0KIW1_9ACTN|nr:OsmC family protein [Gordonia iterans]AVM01617.1 osmotically inducible protein OsmC [Gordonia iterans]
MTIADLIDIPAPTASTPLNAIASATNSAVQADTKKAAVVFSADAVAGEGVSTEARARQFSLSVDEPAALGGADTAANPVEYYLTALLSCQVVTYRFWAQRLGVQVDSITLHAEGDLDVRGFFGLDSDVRPGFTEVRVVVDVTGPDDADRYVELQEVVEAHCPVLDLTVNRTPVVSELRVNHD